ncbi:hypothetical protein [Halarcobacter anaerophilus]|uniref:hypothetical protein n=1 Tax=Halarcobacter anaerophilus TaxID=877500 RepID=UPI0005C9A7AC|nr:hypothetical protein [Halarcobacter anaerophilus]
MKTLKKYLFESKPKIGLVHGISTILGSFILAFLSMMVFSKFMQGDFAFKVMPSVVFTPVLTTVYGFWLLFSKNLFACFSKIFLLVLILAFLLKGF